MPVDELVVVLEVELVANEVAADVLVELVDDV